MSIKLFIRTREIPKFDRLVKKYKINSYPQNPLKYECPWGESSYSSIPIRAELLQPSPRWHYFEDITGELSIIAALVGYNDLVPTIRYATFSAYGETRYKTLLTVVSGLEEHEIDSYIENLFNRPTVYWDQWKGITIPFLKANLHFLKAIVAAGIEEIVYVERTR